jgi:hypothetical protein
MSRVVAGLRLGFLDMWLPVTLPDIEGPIRGFTLPSDDVLYVVTPAGLVRVSLNPVEVRTVADAATLAALYDPHSEKLPWDGKQHLVYDGEGGDITLCDHPNGDRIVPDKDGTLLIMDPDEREVRQRIASIRLPTDGSWMFAGFSQDYRWLVAGEPAGVQVFRQE